MKCRSEDGFDIIFVCDECEGRETFSADIYEWETVKQDHGWRAFLKGDFWQHACRACVTKWARSNFSKVNREEKPSNQQKKAYEVVVEALTCRGFSDNEAHVLIKKCKREMSYT